MGTRTNRFLKATTLYIALALLGCTLCFPLVQRALTWGPQVRRENILAWSVGLGQIAFGLVAAFLILTPPYVFEVVRLKRYWDRKSSHLGNSFKILAVLEMLQTKPFGSNDLHSLIKKIIEKLKHSSAPSGSKQEKKVICDSISHQSARIVSFDENWRSTVHSGTTQELSVEEKDKINILREYLLSVIAQGELHKRRWIIRLGPVILILVNLVFGTLVMAPDPFWFIKISSIYTSSYPLPQDYYYPEFAMWTTATIHIIDMFLFASWISWDNLDIRLFDPKYIRQ
jgi:hypothetical protein